VDLSIVIVSWNVQRELRQCLRSLEPALASIEHEIIVVDNASQDGSVEMLESEFPQVRIHRNARNEGFAKACNQGFEQCGGKHVLILNPDTQVEHGAINALLQLLDREPRVGAVGPLITDRHGRMAPACRRGFPRLAGVVAHQLLFGRLIHELKARTTDPRTRKRREQTPGVAPCLSGACMMIRREVLRDLNGFDDVVPMYLDDNDLCFRISEQGLQCYFLPQARVIHHGARSVSKLPNRRMSSLVSDLAMDAFFYKHISRLHVWIHHLALTVIALVLLAVDLVLWPLLALPAFGFIRDYSLKHLAMLVYGLTLVIRTKALPDHWPRSAWEVFRLIRDRADSRG